MNEVKETEEGQGNECLNMITEMKGRAKCDMYLKDAVCEMWKRCMMKIEAQEHKEQDKSIKMKL